MKALLILVIFLTSLTRVFAQDQAYIKEMSGTVEIKLPGSADWIPAKTGDGVSASTIISTGFKSTAILSLGNSTLTIRPLTRLSLEEILSRDENETINIMLRTGRVRADVAPPVGGKIDFNIRSPIVTASVRGTVFDFDTLNLEVMEGTVVFAQGTPAAGTPRRSVQVNAGDRAWVDQDSGKVVNPLRAAETSIALPVLPGQVSVLAADNGAKTASPAPSGSLVVDVILESKR
jgi:hypothetical protein